VSNVHILNFLYNVVKYCRTVLKNQDFIELLDTISKGNIVYWLKQNGQCGHVCHIIIFIIWIPRHTITRVPYLNNISNITTMCVIKIIKMFVFIHFWYEGFNGVICLYLAPMLVHQFLCCQC